MVDGWSHRGVSARGGRKFFEPVSMSEVPSDPWVAHKCWNVLVELGTCVVVVWSSEDGLLGLAIRCLPGRRL